MAGADMCSVGHKSVLPNRNRQMTYMHRGNCRSSVCRSKGGRPLMLKVMLMFVVASGKGGVSLAVVSNMLALMLIVGSC